MFWVAVASVVLALISSAIAGARHKRLNRMQGVIAHWEGLRITRTELIEGYKRKAMRRPLRGLAAEVAQGDGKVSVVVEGPDTFIVATTRAFTLIDRGKPVPRAHEFVAALNLASRQA
jgi:hypothetical protein